MPDEDKNTTNPKEEVRHPFNSRRGVFGVTLEVVNKYTQYQGLIFCNGFDYVKAGKAFYINSTLSTEKNYIDDKDKIEITGTSNIQKAVPVYYILSKLNFEQSQLDDNHKIDGSLEVQKEKDTAEITGTVSIPIPFTNKPDIYGECNLQITDDHFGVDLFPCKFEVKEICYRDEFDAKVDMLAIAYPHNADDPYKIDCDLKYEEEYRTKDIINGNTKIVSCYNEFYIYAKTRLCCNRYIYSIFTQFAVEPSVDKYIDCYFTVDAYNKEFYGEVNIFPEEFSEIQLDGNVFLQYYVARQIDSKVTLDYTQTIRDIYTTIGVIGYSEYDITCGFIAIQPNELYDNDALTCNFETGYKQTKDFYIDMEVIKKDTCFVDFPAKLEVMNYINLPKTRIVIAVDPLWDYEPYVVINSLHTLFNRIYHKYDVDIVYGGSPRSDFDIEHIAHMYGVPFRNMHKAPLVWDPRHPWKMRESVDNFIKTMYTFKRCSKRKSIGLTVLFADGMSSNRNSLVRQIAIECKKYRIPCVIIHADGTYNSVYHDRHDYDKNHHDIHMDHCHNHFHPHIWDHHCGTHHHYGLHHHWVDPYYDPGFVEDPPFKDDHKIIY